MIAGSFGPATRLSHNVYEDYISPLVTSGLIAHTIEYNQGRDEAPD